ncbi:outer membrane protein assembly factor BamB family protein [Bremerella sp. T1]|uniref:outer membrane protein assembly factor BamB family protein n=1 Tax=Bremerella sp. TYQ1 TaxID=3119568 RepID=UPI001CC9A7CC|nr:PQQ-binding-like beta-propeller repeat protein [Bremerella volcania]UBM37119.1 PQQ-like beta-propeller repeat protein [Bremerella volcania]
MKRFNFLAFAVASTLACFTYPAVGLSAEHDANWSNWRGPNFDGSSTVATPPVKWSEEDNIRWKVAVSGKGSSSPVIWGDKLFLLSAVPVEGAEPEEAESEPAPSAENRGPERPTRDAGERPSGRDAGPGDRPGRRGRSGGPGGRGGFGRRESPSTPVEFTVFCLDKTSGKQLWSQIAVTAVPHEAGHNTNTFASSSAVTNGEILVAFFGSRGIFCYDLDGELLWQKDLGEQQTRNAFGEGSTPALYQDTIIVPWDHEGESFVAAFHAKTGDELWKVERDEATSWATPVVTKRNDVTQVILNGSTKVRSYDLKTGKLIWECGGQATNPIATPIIYNGTAICMTGYRGYAVYAISLDAKGDVTDNDDFIAWSRSDVGPYIASATLWKDRLYVTKSRDGVIYCLDANTGETIYGPERVPECSTLYSSLVAGGDRIYVSDRDGTTAVLKAGPDYDVLSVNQLNEGIDASLALLGNQIYLRGSDHLYCIEAASK